MSALYDLGQQKTLRPVLRPYFKSVQQALTWSENNWQRLEDDLRTHRPHTTILSSEHFADVRQLDQMLERLRGLFNEIRVIAYIRDPASHYCSLIDQRLRGGFSLHELPAPWHYEAPGHYRVERYLERLGSENLAIRPFNRSRMIGNDVVTDFFATLGARFGLEAPPLEQVPLRNNSLAGASAAWLATMNETFVRMPSQGGGGDTDRETIARRLNIVNELRNDPALARLPRLALPDAAIADTIRYNARETLSWYNTHFLHGDDALSTGAEPAATPSPEEAQVWLRDWVLSYLTPEAVPLVSRCILTAGAALAQTASAPGLELKKAEKKKKAKKTPETA